MNRRSPIQARRAFSFVELMFVVVVLGVLAAVALPRFAGAMRGAALQSTARDLAAISSIARQSAVTSQQETMLVLDQEQRRWFLNGPVLDERERRRAASRSTRVEPLARSDEEQPRRLDDRVRFHQIAPPNGRVYSDRDTVVIRFFPNGASSGATIVLADDRDRRMTVEIEAATGRAVAYNGGPRSFQERLEQLGVDPAQFGIETAVADAKDRQSRDGFTRIGGEAERTAFYADAAARIMGRVERDVERANNLDIKIQNTQRDADLSRVQRRSAPPR